MDEVDNIIAVTLRQIGCGIGEDVVSLSMFTTDLIVEGCSRCLKLIDDKLDLPLRLPESMSVRFRIGTAIADACKSVGYDGEIGYQTFLYSNVADVRRVFMFLMEKLPRDASEAEDSSKSTALLQSRISSVLRQQRSRPWTPLFCKRKGLVTSDGSDFSWEGVEGVHYLETVPVQAPSGLADLSRKSGKDHRRNYYRNHMPFITAQPAQRHQVAPSLLEHHAMEVTAAAEWELEWNTNGLPSRLSEQDYRQRKRDRLHKRLTDNIRSSMQATNKNVYLAGSLAELLDSFTGDGTSTSQGSRFSHAKNLQFTKVDASTAAAAAAATSAATTETAEEMRARREKELAGLSAKLDALTDNIGNMELDMQKFSTNMGKLEEQTRTTQAANDLGKDEYKLKKRALEMLSNADENLASLQALVDSASQRLVSLAEQWEKHRQPLMEKHRTLKSSQSELTGETRMMLDEIPVIRKRIKDMMEEGREKEYRHQQLVEELDQLDKSLTRSSYTRRIIEIINNIRKQKDEIHKILSDTRELQKEINALEGEVDRAFAETDELAFADCKKFELNRAIYKLLAKLHETFVGLLSAIRDTAVTVRENRELEDQIDTELKKNTTQSLQRMESDFNAMKQENRVLTARYKMADDA